ncbi:hypothetical protein D3C59_30070 [Streptomyces sp. SHP22-7]|nr:hypothetical protein D3C59_35980 [Streptomyces sp. SHP22-7]RIH58603.1 hypothetical protein D3C59_33970 [Streptomyces sp. SHP22-7]RIH58757.1 hypothetical protein D3C59_32985 [Streptomyces sp. SHP22-7]RIH59111.1 hypothetical protein D3C59_30070 [Streptomyces sp. SHP22-7]
MEMAEITKVTEDIYYGWIDQQPNPVFWHWCAALADVPEERTVSGQWVAAGTEAHTLVSSDPLHLEPSLLWPCCGLHGWVRNGQWEAA